jgi:preprotein translocase SecE subunit
MGERRYSELSTQDSVLKVETDVKDDKDQMTTAVTANPAGDDSGKGGPKPGLAPRTTGWQAYKPGDGYATRLGMMVVVMAYVAFACHHWFYNWVYLRNFLESMFTPLHLTFLTNWTYELTAAKILAGGGAMAIAALGFMTAYYFIYVKPGSAEFLVKTDTELSKVTWPKITPWFKMETQVWGATYVVLIVVAMLTAYVFGVDIVLQKIANMLFYGDVK